MCCPTCLFPQPANWEIPKPEIYHCPEYSDVALVRLEDYDKLFQVLRQQEGVVVKARWLNEAIWFLGLSDTIESVTPYGSAGEMLQHVIIKAADLEKASTALAARPKE